MKRITRNIVTLLLVMATMFTANGISSLTSAAAATMKLSTSTVTLTVGSGKTVTLQNAPKDAKAVWSSKNAKIATVKNGKITGVAAGSTKVECKVTYTANKKKTSKTFTVNVTVKNKVTPTPTVIPEKSNLKKEHKSANSVTTRDNGLMRKDLSSQYLIKNYMGQGWNLGNTMEATRMESSDQVSDYESAWAAPITTQKAIDGIHQYGINTVRIPIAWSNMISDDGKYTINPEFMDRVEEIINYCLNNEMYVIINIHYDRGWWGQFGAKDTTWREKAWARYESLWTQIANRYKEYSDRLIFESANEELGDRLNDELDVTTGYAKSANRTGVLSVNECYKLVNQINQKFVDIVRKTGGNNTNRHLLIAGYDTDITKTTDKRFVMPKDISNKVSKLSVSVHYYTPSTYCIAETADNSWGYTDTWGKPDEKNTMKEYFKKMKEAFSDKGYGVMIGEYGVCSATKKGIPDFYYEVMKNSKDMGFLPIMWDTGLWYDRITGQFKYKDVLEKILSITKVKAEIPADADVTGKVPLVLVDESELTTVFTWQGTWLKNDGSNIGLDGKQVLKENGTRFVKTKKETKGMTSVFNSWGYQAFFAPDWSAFTQPCIRFYFKADNQDAVGALTLAYCDVPNGSWFGTSTYEYAEGWSGKCIQLDLGQLKKHNNLMITFGNNPIITKIEILDIAK